MKKLAILSLVIIALLQSCAKPLVLPSELSRSLLLIEKLPTDSVVRDEKGKKTVVERNVGGWASMLNRRSNAKIQKVFATYPFDYKIISEEEVGDNIDTKRTTYFLKNGSTVFKTKYMTGNAAHGGAPRAVEVAKTKVILENLTKSRKSTLGEFSSGVAGISGKFVKSAIKMKKSKKK